MSALRWAAALVVGMLVAVLAESACSSTAGTECTVAADCTALPPDDACQRRSCEAGHCGQVFTGAGTPLVTQVDGDCQQRVCDGQGATLQRADDDDLPFDDELECTTAVCTRGVPGHEPVAARTPCGAQGALYCDGSGACVGCTEGSQCGAPLPCRQRTCAAGVCGLEAQPDDTPCTDGLFCNGVDYCQAGACARHLGAPCVDRLGDNDLDCSEACDEAARDCVANEPAGSHCFDGFFCNGSDTCDGAGQCAVHGGDPCPGPDGDADCSEACNEASGTCTSNDPNGASCDDGAWCNGTDACSSGACSVHTGDPCPGADGDLDCSESCNETANNCTSNDPNGSPCPLGGCSYGACVTVP